MGNKEKTTNQKKSNKQWNLLHLSQLLPCSPSQLRLREMEIAIEMVPEMVTEMVAEMVTEMVAEMVTEKVVVAVVESLAASEIVMVPLLVAELGITLMVLLVVDSCTKTKEKILLFALSGRTLTSGMALTMKTLILAPLTLMFTPKTSTSAWTQPLSILRLDPSMLETVARAASSTLRKPVSCSLAEIVS